MSRIHADVSSSFKDSNGDLVEYFRGDTVKPEHEAMLDDWGALVPVGEEHLTPEQRMDRALNPDLVTAEVPPDPPDPAGGTGEPVTGDYDGQNVGPLQAEIERRQAAGRTIEVEGTGQGGNILKTDLVSALEADDAAGA